MAVDIISLIDAPVEQSMYRIASLIMQVANQNITEKNLPSIISDNMKVANFKRDGEGRYSIEVSVDLDKAPMATAYEFGSGIHATRGVRSKYTITPKNSSALAFEWNPAFVPWGSPKFIGLSGKKFLFRYVKHPGVEQKAFLAPAAEESASAALGILGNSLVEVASLAFEFVIR